MKGVRRFCSSSVCCSPLGIAVCSDFFFYFFKADFARKMHGASLPYDSSCRVQ